TVASFKGGVGKTTTAIHLAAYLQQHKPTLLIDGDANRSATLWAKRGELPFRIVDDRKAPKFARDYEHIVIDTYAHPNKEDLESIVEGCDLLILPTTPEAMALDALVLTVTALRELRAENYRILLTMIPPKPNKDGQESRELLERSGYPLFKGGISRLTAFQRASMAGVPVYATADDRAERAWEEYVAVAKEMQ
ncbi:MAG: ParA family protein, partial [Acidobacteriota bacterium]